LGFKADGAESAYAGGGGQISLQAVIENQGSSACELDSTLRLEVDQDGKALRSIRGDPSTIHIHHLLDPIEPHGDPLTIEWIWIGWCGSSGGVTVGATMAGLHSSDPSPVPVCEHPTYLDGATVKFGLLP
jgi:hypothetical protein